MRREKLSPARVLAIWPPLRQLTLLASKVRRSPVGVVVWSYDRDVAPLFDTPDDASDAVDSVRTAR